MSTSFWSHQRLLLVFTIISRVVYFVILQLSAQLLPLFDTSPRLIPTSKWAQPSLRWDSFYFLHIAQHGYLYENQWAFFPGAPFVIRHSSTIFASLTAGRGHDILAGAMVAMMCDSTQTLYKLSLHHLGSSSLAFLAALLSLMPSSPTTLYFTPYTEPFFTYLSYKGMYFCSQKRWFAATMAFTLAGTFRSNGILLSGFVVWGIIIQPFLEQRRLILLNCIYALILTVLIAIPLVHHNYSAYLLFCIPKDKHLAKWCTSFPPSIYTYAQATYWNVGFLRYWTLAQLPNFVIAAPPFALLFTFSIYHLKNSLFPRIRTLLLAPFPSQLKVFENPFFSSSLSPHAMHALLFSAALLLASHTQIVLRLAASMPIVYWAAAWLVVEHPKWGRWWVAWSVGWGFLSTSLWGAGLPPA